MNREHSLMIDYRDLDGKFVRKVIDNFEFCVRDGMAHFLSEGVKCRVPLQDISQVYTY